MQNRSVHPYRDPRTAIIVEQAIDVEHVRLLAVFHYVVGGFTIAMSCMFLLHFVFGLIMMASGMAIEGEGSARLAGASLGGLVAMIGLTCAVVGWIYGGLTVYTGRCLQKYKHRTFTLVMSVLNCLQVPWGLVLGLLTIKVLLKDHVRECFERGPSKIPVDSLETIPGGLAADAFSVEESMWKEMEEKARASSPNANDHENRS